MPNRYYNARFTMGYKAETDWGKSDPVLLRGEVVYSVDQEGNVKSKVGNGIKKWSELPFVTSGGGSSETVNNSKISIEQGNVIKGSFTLNQSDDQTIVIDDIPTIAKVYGVGNVGAFYGGAVYDGEYRNSLYRTDNAVGLDYQAVSKQAADGSMVTVIESDFDYCYPWSEITKVIINGNSFIKIPKFYSKIELDTTSPTSSEYSLYKYQISGTKYTGFSTLFTDGHGNEIPYILVGAYEGIGGTESGKSVVYSKSAGTSESIKIYNNGTDATNQSNARADCVNWNSIDTTSGNVYHLYDYVAQNIIEQLFIVEFATTNSQSVMLGATTGSSYNAGATDKIVNSTTDSQAVTGYLGGAGAGTACKYRGIENPWGNYWKRVDGIAIAPGYQNKSRFKYSITPEFYSDIDSYRDEGPATDVEGEGNIVVLGKQSNVQLHNPLLVFPQKIGLASAGYGAHYYDQFHCVPFTDQPSYFLLGGVYGYGEKAGLFCMYTRFTDYDCARLCANAPAEIESTTEDFDIINCGSSDIASESADVKSIIACGNSDISD